MHTSRKTIIKPTKIDLIHSTIELRSDGIVEVHFLENQEFGLKEVNELLDAYDVMLEPKKYPILHVPHSFVSFSKEAKEFSVTERGAQYSLAEAYIFSSLAHRIVGNFYLSVNRPKVPTKLFNNVPDAEKWLLAFN